MTKTLLILIAAAAIAATLVGSACRTAAPTSPQPTVLVTAVIQRDIPIYSEWVGTTVGFVDAQIRARVQGYLLRQNYEDGHQVKTGQLLFQIDDRDYKAALDQALGALARQQATLRKNQLDLARYKPLAAEGAVSRQELDDATQATHESQAEVESAQAAVETARLNLGWTQVLSPIDGVAGIAPVQVGDLVTPSTVLTSVSQIDPIKVSFPISEQEYLRAANQIKEHQQTGRAKDEPDLELILGDGSLYKYPGHFYDVNRQVDIQTGTIEVQGLFPNPDALLRPGQYAKVRAATQTRRHALLVPQRAVQETQGEYQVAVVGADNTVAMRTVKPGDRIGSLWIVNEGLNPGERVITEGLQKVKDGMEVVPQAASAPEESSTPASAAPRGQSSNARPAAADCQYNV
jgi:membrane fusion protein (multidrug efflux system)